MVGLLAAWKVVPTVDWKAAMLVVHLVAWWVEKLAVLSVDYSAA